MALYISLPPFTLSWCGQEQIYLYGDTKQLAVPRALASWKFPPF